MFYIVTSLAESRIGNLKVTSYLELSLMLPSFSPAPSGSSSPKSPLLLRSLSTIPPKNLIVDVVGVVS
jgi:hypothetical protein